MLIDVLIVLFLITGLLRGRDIGFVQQLFSGVGFLGGLLLGGLLQPQTVKLANSPLSRITITLITILGLAAVGLLIGELIGALLKQRFKHHRINRADESFGAIFGVLSILLTVWLGTSALKSLSSPGLQAELRSSKIVSYLSRALPAAPGVIADLGHLISPNGFPQVFIGGEPAPPKINLPPSSQLAAAVGQDRTSVVKIEGQGCGGIVEGSGFVVGADLIATNAHVVAGIQHPFVIDANGNHSAAPVWFDPNLDFAVLRVSNLAGRPLPLSGAKVPQGTAAAVMGYPGGGGFVANPAQLLREFSALGRNIYGQGTTARDVYEVAAKVIPGNSGGPVVNADGTVIGVVFAESTDYNRIGYALAMPAVISAINQAASQGTPVNTASCAAD